MSLKQGRFESGSHKNNTEDFFPSHDAYISFKVSREDFDEDYFLDSKKQCSPNVKHFIVGISLYINKLLSSFSALCNTTWSPSFLLYHGKQVDAETSCWGTSHGQSP